MKICHYLPSLKLNNGGPPRSVGNLCSHLVRQCASVTIATTFRNEDPEISIDAGIKRANFRKSSELRSFVNPEDFNLVHQHGIWLPSSHAFSSSAIKQRIPIILSPRGMLEPWSLRHNKLKKKIAWALYQKKDLACVTGFHATAMAEANQIRNLGFQQPIAIIPNGIDMPSASDLPYKEHNKVTKIKVLFISRLHEKKGLDLLLKAWSILSPSNAELHIVGNDDGGYKVKLLKIKNDLGLGHEVKISDAKYGKSKVNEFNNADLFILPSYSENFGIVVAEAMSYGLPVITTKGCPWEELERNRCGWWVQPNFEGILGALQAALKLPKEELNAMGLRGKVVVEKKYQWESISQNMSEFYNYILNDQSKPDFVL